MPRTSNKIGSHKTSIYNDGKYTNVVYHETAVVRFNEDVIILDTGGYYTNTTKRRMNEAARQFNLNYNVYQSKGEWYVEHKGWTCQFADDGMLYIERENDIGEDYER